MLRVLFLSSLFAAANGQDGEPCSVCGDGKEVTAPDAIFAFPGQPLVPCNNLQSAGAAGQIELASCAFLPGLIGICECADIVVPTPAPVEPSIPAGGCPAVPDGGCNICAEGQCVSNPDAIFMFPGQPDVPCAALQEAGFGGSIPLDQCGFLASLIGVCECKEGTAAPPPPPTGSPVEPTPAPVVAPTPAPIGEIMAPVTAAPIMPVEPTPSPLFILTASPVEATMVPVTVTISEGGMGGMGMGSGGMGSKEKKSMGDSADTSTGEYTSTMGMSMRSRKLSNGGVAPGIRGN